MHICDEFRAESGRLVGIECVIGVLLFHLSASLVIERRYAGILYEDPIGR